jgi:predicted PurR-regulated permease PerM
MTRRSESGIAFILLAIIAYVISYVLIKDVTDQLQSVINSLPEADASVANLTLSIKQCGYVRMTVMVLANIMFGIGVYYYRSGRVKAKG